MTPRQREADARARERIRAFQKARGWTLEELADWFGVHVATLNNWLVRGRRVPGWPLEMIIQHDR